jgi:hypothetical protein
MHTHTHHTLARFTLKEARLCYHDAPSPKMGSDIINAEKNMRQNPDVIAARHILDNDMMRRQYPQLEGQNPIDRTYYQALVLDKVFKGKEYKDLKREDMAIYDPFGLLEMTNEQRGNWLLTNINPTFLKTIENTDDPERLGQTYKDQMLRAKTEWERTGNIKDETTVQRLPIERYLQMRQTVDAVLQKNGIRIPAFENEMRNLGNVNLSRREYFLLLAKIWRGELDMETLDNAAGSAQEEKLEKVRDLIRDNINNSDSVEKLYIQMALPELGSTEALNGMGIFVTPNLIQAYINALKNPSYGPASSVSRNVTLAPGQGAASWEAHPDYAYEFLSKHMGVPDTQNQNFLDSLKYHYVLSSEERATMPVPPLDEKSTRAILKLVSQSLLEVETVFAETAAKTNTLKKSVSLTKNVEKTGAEVWKYMLDIQSHPIGSILAWGAAIGAATMLWKYFNRKKSNFEKLFLAGAIGGLAVGIYQQNKNGRAWWEPLGEKLGEWMGHEKTKAPEEQTLPNYWSKELELTGAQNEVILSALCNEKAREVTTWYQAMHTWKQNGSPKGQRPGNLVQVDSRLKQYFGESNNNDRHEMIYTVLEKFLADRGRKLREEFPDYTINMQIQKDDQVGLTYMNDRYVEQKYYNQLLKEMQINVRGVMIESRKITDWNPSDPDITRLRTTRRDVYTTLVEMHEEYVQHTRAHQDFDMSLVFLLEANPEILRRRGRAGTEAANIASAAYQNTKNSSFNVFAGPPEDMAKPEELFVPPEKDLFEKVKDMKLVGGGTKLTTYEEVIIRTTLIPADILAFLERLPADDKTKNLLKVYTANYLLAHATDPLVDLMNDIEKKKYQLLIAASKSDRRLSADLFKNLDPKVDGTWDATFDALLDYALPDKWIYPRITSFYDLRTIFDSEATQPGGVQWWKVWQRMFPKWELSKMSQLDERVKSYQDAFTRLRLQSIIEAGPGKTAVLSKEQIDAMEMQLAERMANRMLEAMLITHGDPNYTPDAAAKRGVTPIEQANLNAYFETLFKEVVGKDAKDVNPDVKIPGLLENINNYIWNELPGDVISATEKATGAVKYYVWEPVKKAWIEIAIPFTKEALNQIGIAAEKINDYVWNRLPGDVWMVTNKVTNTVKYYILDPVTKFWVEQGYPFTKEALKQIGIAAENVNDYLWNRLPGDVMMVINKTTGAVKYYVWDPVAKFWIEQGFPEMQKYWEKTAKPFLKKAPGWTMEMAASGYYFVNEASKKTAVFAWETIEESAKKFYEIQGVPKDKYDAFIAREQSINSYKNAGLGITFVGTDKVKFGQFDGIPFTNDGTVIELTVDEFLDTSRDLIKEYREKAFPLKEKELSDLLATPEFKNISATTIQIDPSDPETVIIQNPKRPSLGSSKSSIFDITYNRPFTILQKFDEWSEDIAKGKINAATEPDALKYVRK